MSHPPTDRDKEYSRTHEEDVNLDTENNDNDDYEESRSLRGRSDPNAPSRLPFGSHTLNQDVIKRRTGGILTNLNILHSDRERENLHSISKIKGDGVVREEHLKSLKYPPKKNRMFKECLVTGRFREISKEIEPEIDESKLYPIDEEDILEYRLFNSIDIWARRISSFLNLVSGVIVGMFVVQVLIVSALSSTQTYNICWYYSQIFTFFVNLGLVFSIAETLVSYEKYVRLNQHHHPDTVRFQTMFIISTVTSIVFFIGWCLLLLLPFAVLSMAFKDTSTISSNTLSIYENLIYEGTTLLNGAIYTVFFIISPFIGKENYVYDSYEMMYSDDDIYAPEPDAIEMTAFA